MPAPWGKPSPLIWQTTAFHAELYYLRIYFKPNIKQCTRKNNRYNLYVQSRQLEKTKVLSNQCMSGRNLKFNGSTSEAVTYFNLIPWRHLLDAFGSRRYNPPALTIPCPWTPTNSRSSLIVSIPLFFGLPCVLLPCTSPWSAIFGSRCAN